MSKEYQKTANGSALVLPTFGRYPGVTLSRTDHSGGVLYWKTCSSSGVLVLAHCDNRSFLPFAVKIGEAVWGSKDPSTGVRTLRKVNEFGFGP